MRRWRLALPAMAIIALVVAALNYGSPGTRAFRISMEAEKLSRPGKFHEAIKAYSDAIQLEPKYVQRYVWRARDFERTGDHDHALADLDTAIRLQPDYTEAFIKIGRAHV